LYGSDSEASIISHDRVALWLDPERIILYQISGGLDVYNVHKGEVETRLTEEQFPYINNIYPFQDNGSIGFISFDENGSGEFNLYNHYQKTILSHRGLPHIQYLTYWVASPSEFPGRQNCRK
jgi:hypothetical protein